LSNVASYYGMLGEREKVAEILKQLEEIEIPNIKNYFSITILYEQWMNDRIKALEGNAKFTRLLRKPQSPLRPVNIILLFYWHNS